MSSNCPEKAFLEAKFPAISRGPVESRFLKLASIDRVGTGGLDPKVLEVHFIKPLTKGVGIDKSPQDKRNAGSSIITGQWEVL